MKMINSYHLYSALIVINLLYISLIAAVQCYHCTATPDVNCKDFRFNKVVDCSNTSMCIYAGAYIPLETSGHIATKGNDVKPHFLVLFASISVKTSLAYNNNKTNLLRKQIGLLDARVYQN